MLKKKRSITFYFSVVENIIRGNKWLRLMSDAVYPLFS